MGANDVDVVVADLRYDAAWWDNISETMNNALKIMQEFCYLPYATFDGVSHVLGATKNYESTHEQMTTLLSGGVSETASIAERLRVTANNIEAADV